MDQVAPDACYRCGYELRGIADQQPCPECGLLAKRSRRTTDELHNTRPRWLRRISRGVWIILLTILMPVLWAVAYGFFVYEIDQLLDTLWPWIDWRDIPLVGIDLAAILLIPGVFLLTTPERYQPADAADKTRRIALRILSMLPMVGMILAHHSMREVLPLAWSMTRISYLVPGTILTIGCAPLPMLLFYQLRSLAKRARSAHLAEHCAIVGIGTSLALLYGAGYIAFAEITSRMDLGIYWLERSMVALIVMLILTVAASLFILWSLYLLIRFAIAFHLAARELNRKWQRDDRANAEPASLA